MPVAIQIADVYKRQAKHIALWESQEKHYAAHYSPARHKKRKRFLKKSSEPPLSICQERKKNHGYIRNQNQHIHHMKTNGLHAGTSCLLYTSRCV